MKLRPVIDQDVAITNCGVPPYRQVAAILRAGIGTGTYPVSSRLPSVAQLRERFGLAPMTCSRALQVLVSEGLAVGEQGRGFYVVAAHPDHQGGARRGTAKRTVEVLYVRDPDAGTDVRVWLDGQEIPFREEGVDPGYGHLRSDWEMGTAAIRADEKLSPSFRDAVISARNAWATSKHIEQDLEVEPPEEGTEATCGCGYPLVWTGEHWEHDVAPWRWGDDHDPDPEP